MRVWDFSFAMQYPSEIPGITNAEFLRAAMKGKEDDEKDFSSRVYTNQTRRELLNMKEEWLSVTSTKALWW